MSILILIEVLRKKIKAPEKWECECEKYYCVGGENPSKIPWMVRARQPDRSDARLVLASIGNCSIRKNGK